MKTLKWGLSVALVVGACVNSVCSVYAVAAPARLELLALVSALDDDQFEIRQAADQRIRRLGKEIVPQLRLLLAETTSLEVRSRLEQIVDALTLEQRFVELTSLLAAKNPQSQAWAAWQIRRCGEQAVPLLEQELVQETLKPDYRQRLAKLLLEVVPLQR